MSDEWLLITLCCIIVIGNMAVDCLGSRGVEWSYSELFIVICAYR